MMKKSILFIFLMVTLISLNAQNAQVVVTSHDPVPDPLAFCIGESITVELQDLDPDLYESLSAWYKCSEEPDLIGFSNYDLWEYIPNYELTYTFDLSEEVYIWANVSDLNFGYATPALHFTTAGTIPVLIYNEADTAFCEGSTVVLSANPSDLGAGNYMWFKDGLEITGENTANYSITEAGFFHVETKDINSECPDNFIPSTAVEFSLIKPVIFGDLKIDLNRMSFSTDDIYASYQWYSGPDELSLTPIAGATTYAYDATISATDTYYAVEVETTGGCTAMSNVILVNNIIYGYPVIVEPSTNFACRDESIELSVENDVYASYQWYKNDNSIYGATNASITVNNSYNYGTGSYTVKVTTILDETDELESNAVNIEIAVQPQIFVLDNATFCPGADITLYSADDFDSYQWLVNDSWDISTAVDIAGATDTAIIITVLDESRYYFLRTTYNSCEDASNDRNVSPYSLYPPNVYTSSWGSEGTICLGDSIQLKGGGYDVTWQWYLNDELAEGIVEKDPYVNEIGSYTLEITSVLCPDLDPVMSNNAVVINYTVSPDYSVDPEGQIYNNDPNHIIFCAGEAITLSVIDPDNYEAWQWMGKLFDPGSSSDEWEDLEDENTSILDFINGENDKLHFKVRVDSIMGDGTTCSGISDYKTIDGWVFQSPVIASYDNSELCEEGDSTLMHLGFAGEWQKFEWYLDGTLIPDSDNDTIYGKEEGMYTLTAYPEICPDIPHSSGLGPTVQFMPQAEIFENDTVIYAMPEYGEYYYQWYYSETNPGTENYIDNMQAIDMDTLSIPWVIYFDQMAPGYYAVEVNNPLECLRVSELYPYNISSVENISISDVQIYPNPVNENINIILSDIKNVRSVEIYNITGMLVKQTSDINTTIQIPMNNLENGVYIIKINFTDFNSKAYRVIKN